MELGIIEGFYGRPWSWSARTETIVALAGHGYTRHLYAPKADQSLRDGWRTPLTDDWLASVSAHQVACQNHGVSFGIGLSLQAYDRSSVDDKTQLKARLGQLAELKIESIAVLFDDPVDRLVQSPEDQSSLVLDIAEQSAAESLWVCPTWYSDDPLLDQIYGPRSPDYLPGLCKSLDQSIGVFWAGRKICADGYLPDDLDRVAAEMNRQPTLWDNYPVNDGPQMSPYLHLSPGVGRDPDVLSERISAHFINPALQPVLTRIPAISLARSYNGPVISDISVRFKDAAITVLGEALARQVGIDLNNFQSKGFPNPGERMAMKAALSDVYQQFDHAGAAEIIAWLDGYWADPSLRVDTQPT